MEGEVEVEEVVEEVIWAHKGHAEEFLDVIQVEGEGILGFLEVFRIVYKEEGSKEPLQA